MNSPVLYNQLPETRFFESNQNVINNDSRIRIQVLNRLVPYDRNNSLLLILPAEGLRAEQTPPEDLTTPPDWETEYNLLKVIYPHPTGSDEVVYRFYKENANGAVTPAKTGDLMANRLAIIRLDHWQHQAVICNSPLYGDLTISSLLVTGNTTFREIPKVNQGDEYTPVATIKAIKQSQIQFGFDELSDDALGALPDGSIYFKLKE